nr:2-(3-amino-3-carboxypropyl)histidine synthase subunit 1-like [Pocillopora verrucosa]
MANPSIPAYRYDSSSKVFSREYYDIDAMFQARKDAITTASRAKKFRLILSTLGRQGSSKNLGQRFSTAGLEYVFVLMSEIFPGKLGLFEDVETIITILTQNLLIKV